MSGGRQRIRHPAAVSCAIVIDARRAFGPYFAEAACPPSVSLRSGLAATTLWPTVHRRLLTLKYDPLAPRSG